MTANSSAAGGRAAFDVRAWVRAAGEGDAARVAALLAAGADVNAALESGETALIRAASQGRVEVVRLLLGAGANPNAQREDGFTALGVAVFFGRADIVRALLEGGADRTAEGRLGARIEQWALFSGYTEITELLRGRDGARAPAAVGDAGSDGAPVFFPAEGEFSPVVPLSELDQSRPAGSSEVAGRRGGRETKELEVVTVVRPRAQATRALKSPHAARAARPQLPAQGWPLTVVLLCLSLMAGLLAGNYLLKSRWASSPEPEPTADASVEVVSQPPAPPAEARDEGPRPQAAPPEGASAATLADEKTEKTNEAKPSATSESRRAAGTEAASRGEAAAAVRDARPASKTAGEKPDRVRREPSTAQRGAQNSGARLITAAPRSAAPPPVVSPAPADKSEKRKVVPWP